MRTVMRELMGWLLKVMRKAPGANAEDNAEGNTGGSGRSGGAMGPFVRRFVPPPCFLYGSGVFAFVLYRLS